MKKINCYVNVNLVYFIFAAKNYTLELMQNLNLMNILKIINGRF